MKLDVQDALVIDKKEIEKRFNEIFKKCENIMLDNKPVHNLYVGLGIMKGLLEAQGIDEETNEKFVQVNRWIEVRLGKKSEKQ
ncbi:hypothetical protein CCZ20_27510 [Priestia aryabhattai]|uniref:hypothetical protein n=1 Tax=Priestia aryabhattai TaxID=412384 RepID=UPI000B5036C0|nr:hypothetical protein [Priestia aryabhattai]OVE34255.1 hypothetical protein CCZ20_27510 [Priestia aryabhattai]